MKQEILCNKCLNGKLTRNVLPDFQNRKLRNKFLFVLYTSVAVIPSLFTRTHLQREVTQGICTHKQAR